MRALLGRAFLWLWLSSTPFFATVKFIMDWTGRSTFFEDFDSLKEKTDPMLQWIADQPALAFYGSQFLVALVSAGLLISGSPSARSTIVSFLANFYSAPAPSSSEQAATTTPVEPPAPPPVAPAPQEAPFRQDPEVLDRLARMEERARRSDQAREDKAAAELRVLELKSCRDVIGAYIAEYNEHAGKVGVLAASGASDCIVTQTSIRRTCDEVNRMAQMISDHVDLQAGFKVDFFATPTTDVNPFIIRSIEPRVMHTDAEELELTKCLERIQRFDQHIKFIYDRLDTQIRDEKRKIDQLNKIL